MEGATAGAQEGNVNEDRDRNLAGALRGGGKTQMALLRAVNEIDPEFARKLAEAWAKIMAEVEADEDEEEDATCST